MQTLGEIATDASAAKQLLDSDVFNKCFETMNAQIMDQIVNTPIEASDERERLYMMFKGGQVFVQQFAGLINHFELSDKD